MEKIQIPRSGDRYQDNKGQLYQIVCLATNTQNNEDMVVYQGLFGEYQGYVKPLGLFLEEVKKGSLQAYTVVRATVTYSDVPHQHANEQKIREEVLTERIEEEVNSLLLEFLDERSYQKKFEILSANRNKLTERLINDMATSIDCTVEEGPIEDRIQNLIICLQTMIRFENRRLR